MSLIYSVLIEKHKSVTSLELMFRACYCQPCVAAVLYLKHQQKQEVGICNPLELFKQVQR